MNIKQLNAGEDSLCHHFVLIVFFKICDVLIPAFDS